MPRREVRRYLIAYQALGPMIAVGLAFLVLLSGLSIVFGGERGARVRVVGLVVLIVSILVGIFRSALVIWNTRNLE